MYLPHLFCLLHLLSLLCLLHLLHLLAKAAAPKVRDAFYVQSELSLNLSESVVEVGSMGFHDGLDADLQACSHPGHTSHTTST